MNLFAVIPRCRQRYAISTVVVGLLLTGCASGSTASAPKEVTAAPARTTTTTTGAPAITTGAVASGEWSVARWSSPSSLDQLRDNLRVAGFPSDWPLPPTFIDKTMQIVTREIYPFDLEHVHYKTEWRIESLDLEAAAAQWFPSVPDTYIPAGFEESKGVESFGIFGDTNYLERIARDEDGFARANVRVQTVNSLDANKTEAIVLKLEWEGPLDSVTPTPEFWDWQKQIPDLGLGSPVASDLTAFSIETPSPVTFRLSFEATNDAAATSAVDRIRDATLWTQGATFIQSFTEHEDYETDIAFTVTNPDGNKMDGTIKVSAASESETAKVHIAMSAN